MNLRLRYIAVALVVALSCAAFLAAFRTVLGDELTEHNYSELKRLHAVIGLPSFPSPSKDRIHLWLQESPTRGRLSSVDRDEWPVRATIKFFGAKAPINDLKNVAIISNNGLSVRFVDLLKEDMAVTRGDVVAILLSK